MRSDPSCFKPLDPGRVNHLDPLELKYWCIEFKCTERQLNEAVAQVGEHVTEIRQALAAQKGGLPG